MPPPTLEELMRANGSLPPPGALGTPVDPLTALMQANGALPPAGADSGASVPPPALPQVGSAGPPAGAGAPDEDPNTLGTYGRHVVAAANPVTNLGAMLPFPQALGGSGLDHPFNPVKIKNDMQAVKVQADALWAQGQYPLAVAKYLESFTPILGPMMAHQGDQLEQGQYAAAAGDLTGMAAGAYLTGKAADVAGRHVPAVTRTPRDPVVGYAKAQGIPLTMGQATGNRFLQGTTALSDHTPLGSLLDFVHRRRQGRALARAGDEIAQSVRGGAPVSPDEAGQLTQEALASRRQAHEDYAANRYGVAERAENMPINARMVPRQAGQPPEPMKLPVDRRGVKAALRPLYEQLTRNLPLTREQASQGFKALSQIIHGDDFVPLMVSEEDLGALKALERSATDGREKALARQAVGHLQRAIDQTASTAGPGVERALAIARDAAREGFETKGLLEQVVGPQGLKEPGAVVRQVIGAEDRNIGLLRRVKSQVPQALPGIARSLVDHLLAQKGEKFLADWKHTGAETKTLLFTPTQVTLLDHLAEVSARIARSPNTSGTATASAAGASGLGILANPAAGTLAVLAPGAWSWLMRSPAAVRLATESLELSLKPAGSAALQTARAAQAATLLQAAQRAAGLPALATTTPAPGAGRAPAASAPGSAPRTPQGSR